MKKVAGPDRKRPGTCKSAKHLLGALHALDTIHETKPQMQRVCCNHYYCWKVITCSDLIACAGSCQVCLVEACLKGRAIGAQRSGHGQHVPDRQLPCQARHLQHRAAAQNGVPSVAHSANMYAPIAAALIVPT